MRILKYILLVLFLFNISSFLFSYVSQTSSGISNYLSFVLLIVYFFLAKKEKPPVIFLVLGILYFIISGLNYIPEYNYFISEFIKYLIVIFCGITLVKNTSKEELIFFFGIGALSILVHAFFFKSPIGRYSGFYIDPNAAAAICLFGNGLSFSISNRRKRLIALLLFTFAGILTFSRMFLILWVVSNIIAIIAYKKHAFNFFAALSIFLVVLSLNSALKLDSTRFSILEDLINLDSTRSVDKLNKDSRFDTWALYFDDITNNIFTGKGFKTLSGYKNEGSGVHNSFLMVLGESGILPFLILSGLYFWLIFKAMTIFWEHYYYLIFILCLIGVLLSLHNYFDNYILLFSSIWMYSILTLKETVPKKTELETTVNFQN